MGLTDTEHATGFNRLTLFLNCVLKCLYSRIIILHRLFLLDKSLVLIGGESWNYITLSCISNISDSPPSSDSDVHNEVTINKLLRVCLQDMTGEDEQAGCLHRVRPTFSSYNTHHYTYVGNQLLSKMC
jgi:hypothetical protein